MAPSTAVPAAAEMLHRPEGAGEMYLGPGDRYRFLVTGEETGGAYFAMEAFVPPGGGPPPHIHRNEDETFYVVEGTMDILLAGTWVTAAPGDFVNVPRGQVHRFLNTGDAVSRMIVTFTPSGMEDFFRETLDRVVDAGRPIPDNIDEIAARYAESAPRHGLEFV
jgi:quercetin dioxygenase-like cupin family protein